MLTLRQRLAAAFASLRGRLPAAPPPPAVSPDMAALTRQAEEARFALAKAADAAETARASLASILAAAARR